MDSATIKLGKIDPISGIVTTISPTSILGGGYSLNAGSAIDPNTMTYYFSTGNNIVGVSLITGLLTSNIAYTFSDGQYFDLMRNFENCKTATALRANPSILNTEELAGMNDYLVYPNPGTEKLNIDSKFNIKNISIFSFDGKMIYQQNIGSQQAIIDVANFANGIYILKLSDEKGQVRIKKIIKN